MREGETPVLLGAQRVMEQGGVMGHSWAALQADI